MLSKKFLGTVLVAATAMSGSALATDRTTGTVVGAVVGAAIGHNAGGTEGAVAGAVIGAAVGNTVTRDRDTHVSATYQTPHPVYREAPPPPPVYVEQRTYYEPVHVQQRTYVAAPVVVVEHDHGYDDHPGRGHAHGKHKNKHKNKHKRGHDHDD